MALEGVTIWGTWVKAIWDISTLSLQLFHKSEILPKENIYLKYKLRRKVLKEERSLVPGSLWAVQVCALLGKPLYMAVISQVLSYGLLHGHVQQSPR